MTIKKKRAMPAGVAEKGIAALAIWRKAQAAAKKKGGKVYEQWLADEALKRAQKKTSPMMAIKGFCNNCVGGIKADITNCTAIKCDLFIYRPYQKGETE